MHIAHTLKCVSVNSAEALLTASVTIKLELAYALVATVVGARFQRSARAKCHILTFSAETSIADWL